MLKRIKSILFVICVVMVFTAQTQRPDKKEQQRAPSARPAPVSRPQVQTRKEAPRQVVHRVPSTVQTRMSLPAYQERASASRVYAVPAPAPVGNDRLFHRQHHNHWQPLYNFYDDQYHFYPYVNIASAVDLTTDGVSVGFDGQMYYYDQGTFYQQDEQGQYVAVAPPIGIIISALPINARQINVDGQIYYRYKGVFYIQVAQGYEVVGPVQPVAADS